jgi:hypothetical protein
MASSLPPVPSTRQSSLALQDLSETAQCQGRAER